MAATESVRTILVTGANGFVGQEVTRQALSRGIQVTAAVRPGVKLSPNRGVRIVTVPDMVSSGVWNDALQGVEVVIHTAGRAHVMKELARDPLEEFRLVNSLGTQRLAEAAAAKGTRRLVFVSSIKVNGERTKQAPFCEGDIATPLDPYGVSKLEGEQALATVAQTTGLETCIVRPPLVYGPGVRANFLSLIRWVDSGLPLPFASVENRRSMIGVGNLADFLLKCATDLAAVGQLYLVADNGAPPSVGGLVRVLAHVLGRRANLIPAPPALLRALGDLSGRGAQVRRLCESLEIDSTKARSHLGWVAPHSLEEGLRDTALWYRTVGKAEVDRSARARSR